MKPTKVQLTLRYLKEAGTSGISGLDLDRKVGQKRTAARIQDLEDMGYTIGATMFRQGNTWTKKYTLISRPFGRTQAMVSVPKQYVFNPLTNAYKEI